MRKKACVKSNPMPRGLFHRRTRIGGDANHIISGFSDPRHPAGPEGVESRRSLLRPFAPCFGSPLLVRPVYLLTRSGSLGLRQTHSPKQIGVAGIGTHPVPSHVARKINHASRMLLVAPFE